MERDIEMVGLGGRIENMMEEMGGGFEMEGKGEGWGWRAWLFEVCGTKPISPC